MMKYLITGLFFLCMISFAEAQSTEEDFNQMKKELEEKMQSFSLDMEGAMGEMQQLIDALRKDGLDKRDIIINGDTIILAPSMEMFERLNEMDLSSIFQQMPENMKDMDLFFGGDGTSEMFDMMDEFRDKSTELDLEKYKEEKNQKKDEKVRKKKTYSL